MLRAIAWMLAAACLAAAVWAGSFYALKHRWPFAAQRTLPPPAIPQESRPTGTYDRYMRLAGFPGKREIPCPAQVGNLMVLLLAGQSNAANHAEGRHGSSYGDRVVNYFDGKCYRAESPLLGASGEMGESWTLLGSKLIASGLADRVVLIPVAVGGTPISRWQHGGDLSGMLLSAVDDARSRYRITHVLWHQGESDYFEKTSRSDYTARFYSLVAGLRKHGVDAPIFPAVTTRCVKGPEWISPNPTAQAQQALPDRARGIFAGIDTDALLDLSDRDDTCHYTASGQEKFAMAWLDVLKKHVPRATAATGAAHRSP